MAKGKEKVVFCCTECGADAPNWSGRCPKCGAWNSLKEVTFERIPQKGSVSSSISQDKNKPKKITELDTTEEIRFTSGISEFDRVLGGGAVVGSLVLVGGAPGIGKSTLLLQMCKSVSPDMSILYISGEESERQLKLRANRLGVANEELYVLAETDINAVIDNATNTQPDILIIDSIQTICDRNSDSTPGSVSQIRECTMRLLRLAKEQGITIFIIGHINKEGSIAGPKILEHMVDCVLYFEGEQNTTFRLLRAAKNRFGSTNEIGIFEMNDTGLVCVENPSEMLLSGRPEDAPGTCVTCVMEGTRPLLAEVQALISQAGYNPSRRTNGVDYNRAAMLLAVLEKRGGIPVSNCDAYINVIGGLTLDEPAADLATLLAIASSYLDVPIGKNIAAIGEVGLSGEIRAVSALNQRLSEIARLGFTCCYVPYHVRTKLNDYGNLKIVPVKNVFDAVKALAHGNKDLH